MHVRLKSHIDLHKKYLLVIPLVLISIIVILYLPHFKYSFSSTASSSTNNTIAYSPSFANQEIIDPDFDWIIMKNSSHTQYGDHSTDIESVDYYSDGKMLNATLWLYFPFQVNQSHLNEEVNYGMYIDADFDKGTGYYGIDYKYELHWDSLNEKWTRVLQKWSHFGNTLVLDNQTIAYTNFSKKDSHYVRLSADLDAMLSPEKYNVVFYAEARREGDLVSDLSRTVAIPPPELTLTSTPNSVELRKGETKTIEVKVHTTQGYEPTVNLNASSPSDFLTLDFTQNDTTVIPASTVRIPSYGIATIPLTIRATEDATIAPVTLFIVANSSFPPEELIKPEPFARNQTDSSNPPFPPTPSENIFTSSSLLLTLKEALTLEDQISNFWNKLGAPISFVYGILAGISPLIYTKIKERFRLKIIKSIASKNM